MGNVNFGDILNHFHGAVVITMDSSNESKYLHSCRASSGGICEMIRGSLSINALRA